MTKPKSIERRIRHTVLAAVALTLAVTVTSVLVANERLELAILELDMQAERDFLLGLTDPDQPLLWETADMQGIYVPQALVGSTELPAIFHNHPFPFAEEVEIGPDTFMVTAVSTENGRLYLAKNITLFEQQEGVFERFLVVMCFVMLGVATLLARMTGRRLAAPLAALSRQMADTEPAASMPRVAVASKDWELQAIAQSFNRFLAEIEQYVQREKSLLGMASHELRTPIAIAAGALDGIAQRGQVAQADVAAMSRIRDAVDEMGANVQAILKLTRREAQPLMQVDVAQVLGDVLAQLRQEGRPCGRIRLQLRLHGQAQSTEQATEQTGEQAAAQANTGVLADPVLVKMLLRNLLHNALQHTQGVVDVRLAQHWLEIEDEGAGAGGAGLSALAALSADSASGACSARSANPHTLPGPGLGLFIVTLICERLGWQLQADESAQAGTRLRLHFAQTQTPPA